MKSVLATSLFAAGLASGSVIRRQQSLADCLGAKNVPVSWPSSSDYAGLAKPYNLRLAYQPQAIPLPTTNQHVQDAVSCATQAGVRVQAKSGGHSYASFSSGGEDGDMMIDLQGLQNVTLDTATNILSVGGGVRLGNMAQAAYDQGKRALSHGTCPGVGIGGHSTHGGYGHTSRNWGLALDHIVGADVVLADGSLVKASETENTDLFWAIRGAADSFGIVTTFYMRTEAAPDSVTYFSFSFDSTIYSSKKIFTKAFLHMQDFATNSSVVDNRISFGTYLDGSGYSTSGTFFGTVDEFNTRIRPEFERGLPTATVTVKSYGWIDYLILMGGGTTITEPTTGYDAHDNFFAKSITVPESDKLSAAAVHAFYDYLGQKGDTSFFVIINLYGGPGSAINSKDTSFSSYADRGSLWVFQNYGEGAGSIDYINGLTNAITSAQPKTQFGAYLNYVDPSLSAAEAHDLYYPGVYDRLATLKQTYDPNFTFWNPQAIGVQ